MRICAGYSGDSAFGSGIGVWSSRTSGRAAGSLDGGLAASVNVNPRLAVSYPHACRGNPAISVSDNAITRSAPTCAGEPKIPTRWHFPGPVYPHVYRGNPCRDRRLCGLGQFRCRAQLARRQLCELRGGPSELRISDSGVASAGASQAPREGRRCRFGPGFLISQSSPVVPAGGRPYAGRQAEPEASGRGHVRKEHRVPRGRGGRAGPEDGAGGPRGAARALPEHQEPGGGAPDGIPRQRELVGGEAHRGLPDRR